MIVLTGKALSTQNLYGYTCKGKYARKYMLKDKKKVKQTYIDQAKEQYKGKLIEEGFLGLEIFYFFGTKHRRDIDNYSKALLDAFSGIIYRDDEQVKPLIQDKFYDKKNPRIEIRFIKSYKVTYLKQ